MLSFGTVGVLASFVILPYVRSFTHNLPFLLLYILRYAVTWDGLHKKKLTTLPSFATSIAAMAFNHDGSELAIASSYTYEDGEREHPRDEIFIRPILEAECQRKSAK